MPTTSDVHVDAILSNVAIAYMNKDDSFIADKVFPVVPSDKQSNKYATFDSSAFFRDEAATPRAPGTNPDRVDHTPSTGTYYCDNYEIEHAVPQEVIDNADDPFAPLKAGTILTTQLIKIRREIMVATDVNTSGNWTSNVTLSGTDQWSDFTNSDPLSDIQTGIDTVEGLIGRNDCTMVVGGQVWSKLRYHPDILDLMSANAVKVLTPEILANLLDLKQVLVGRAIYETAVEGGTSSKARIWGKYAWIGFAEAPDMAMLGMPTAGMIFNWTTGNSSTGGRAIATRQYTETRPRATVVGTSTYLDSKVTAADAGYLITAAVA